MSVGLRENQVLSLTICKRLLRDERCLEVTQARCVKCESVDFMQLQDLCVCVPAEDFAEKRVSLFLKWLPGRWSCARGMNDAMKPRASRKNMNRCEEKGPGTSSSLCIVSELQLHLGSPERPFGEGNESRSEGCADVIQSTYSPSCPIRGFVFIMSRSGPTPARAKVLENSHFRKSQGSGRVIQPAWQKFIVTTDPERKGDCPLTSSLLSCASPGQAGCFGPLIHLQNFLLRETVN